MNLINFDITHILVFIILLFLGGLFLLLTYKKYQNKISILFLFFSFVFLLLPIFGFRGGLKNTNSLENTGNILFSIDVSKSMNVLDFEYDNYDYSRLESTKYLINKYLDNNLSNNYGLVVFAGESLEVLPFTKDIDLYKTILSGIDDKNLTKSGTNLNSVFSSILSFFVLDDNIGTIVIFTDGGDELDIESLKQKVKNIKEKKLELIIVGVGDTEGNYIPIGRDAFGNIKYKFYNGNKIVSKLNEKDLKKLSSEYDFEYIRFDDMEDINKIEKLIQKNTLKTLSNKGLDNREDYTRKLVFISFILFLIFLGTEFFEKRRK